MDLIAYHCLVSTHQQVDHQLGHDYILLFFTRHQLHTIQWIIYYVAGHSQLALALLFLQSLLQLFDLSQNCELSSLIECSFTYPLDSTVFSKKVIVLTWLFLLIAYIVQKRYVTKISTVQKRSLVLPEVDSQLLLVRLNSLKLESRALQLLIVFQLNGKYVCIYYIYIYIHIHIHIYIYTPLKPYFKGFCWGISNIAHG